MNRGVEALTITPRPSLSAGHDPDQNVTRSTSGRPARAPSSPLLVSIGVLLAGSFAAWHYATLDLALSHWDARAHLVVARRIFDSLTPGWQQIGAVWLPLPHLLNMIPVQVEAWYRTGASGTAVSVLSMAVAAWALATLLQRTTGSGLAGITGAVLLMANPNVLYLQSTPMTEAVLFGATLLAVALTAQWVEQGAGRALVPGLACAAACMTRYEAWPVTAALIVLSWAVLWRQGMDTRAALSASMRLAMYPAVAIALFVLNSRWTVGSWFVSGGFFVAENDALGQISLAWKQVRDGLHLLSGRATVWPAYASAALIVLAFARSRARASLVLALAPFAAAALPLYAYVQGHPYRIRYSVPLVVACAAAAATGIALLPRKARGLAAVGLVAAVLLQSQPFDRSTPIIAESQRDARNMQGREAVTRFLERHYDGRLIMMSMGSLAHYMHDLSRSGFDLREFLHEGNGELWIFAVLLGPRGHVGWVAIEERAEGGDVLFHRSRERATFLDGFERVAEGGGVALYRAVSDRVTSPGSPTTETRQMQIHGSRSAAAAGDHEP